MQHYEVAIVGGGISGTALYYILAKYTKINRAILLEKYPQLATISSHGSSNSQTIHCGDIETNYSLEKALKVKRAAGMLVHYASKLPAKDIIFKYPKMVLAVGEEETVLMRERYNIFSPHYPAVQLLEKNDIQKIEPKVVDVNGQPRKDPIVAMGSVDEYSTVNFGALAKSFIEQVNQEPNKEFKIEMPVNVTGIEQNQNKFIINTSNGKISADFVVVCAGTYSLLFAHAMGYGKNYTGLPISGGFYFTPQVLNGKVYTVQNDKLPFAAVHGDPDVLAPGKTRFGPTASMLPRLERSGKGTTRDFFRILQFNKAVRSVMWQMWRDRDIRRFLLRNMGYEIPLLHRYLFLQTARKIVPSLQLRDIKKAKGTGGVRVQLIDKEKRSLLLGEAKINTKNGLIFNMTPSPGATSCLASAEEDAKVICDFLNIELFQDQLIADLEG